MRKLISVTLIFFCTGTIACPIDPWYRVARNYEVFMEKADVVFLAKLESTTEHNKFDQTAEFTIIKAFKGFYEFGKTVQVKNHRNSSCSRSFVGEASAWYVFAKLTADNELLIDSYATFVPMRVALETDMGLK
ncbi:hypothetical protein [Aurantivibrio infirmus]